jgi:hypothetical protein
MTSRFWAAAFTACLLSGLLPQPVLADPFLGRWAASPAGCAIEGDTASTSPLTVTEKSVKWFVSFCTIKKSYRFGETLALQAQCASEGKIRVMPIGLKLVSQNRISVTWDKTPAGEMSRCR